MAKGNIASKTSRKGSDGLALSSPPMAPTKTIKNVGAKRLGKQPVAMDPRVSGGEEDDKKKKGKDNKVINFHAVIFRVFKQLRENGSMKISKDTVHVLNTIILDLVQRLGEEAGRLCKYTHHDTMKMRDLQTAVRLVINTRELSSLMCSAGDEAVRRYADSRAPENA